MSWNRKLSRGGTLVLACIGLLWPVAGAWAVPVVNNAGFEADTFATFPGYVGDNGPITGWNSTITGAGVNPGTFGGPFSNNGAIPQGSQVGFIQGNGTLSQTVDGFEPGELYVLSYHANARACCGGAPSAGTEATLGGAGQVANTVITPVGGDNPYYTFVGQPFVATSTMHDIALTHNNPGGDNTLLVDDVRVSHIAPVVFDFGFEVPVQPGGGFDGFEQASGTGNGSLSGSAWTFTGGGGISNRISAFNGGGGAGNPIPPEGNQFAIIQGSNAGFSQMIVGLDPNTAYSLSLADAKRVAGGVNSYEVLLDGQRIFGNTVATPQFVDRTSGVFSPTSASSVLEVRALGGEGDVTAFIDAIRINVEGRRGEIVNIPGLFNTGVDDSGALLTDGAVDPHYAANGSNAFVVVDDTFPIPPWATHGPFSKWISIANNNDANENPGTFTYSTTLDLSGIDPETVEVLGQWAVDNGGVDILVNGVSSGNENVLGFTQFTPFSLTDGFVEGLNTIDFVVSNAGTSLNPTGFRVEFFAATGVGAGVPEPTTGLLAMLAAGALLRRRRTSKNA